jgi:adenylate kinase family enzyme
MKKVLVIGSGGAGKSTLTRRLGEKLGLPVLHLDALFWRPGWVETPRPEWRQTVEGLCAREAWVMDGNFSATLDVRLKACDTVVFLDMPRTVCVWRALKRWVMYRKKTRPDMAAGCAEKFDLKFLHWIWTFPSRSRPKVVARLDEFAAGKRVVRLRSDAEVERFLAEVG